MVNAGSASLKLALVEGEAVLEAESLPVPAGQGSQEALEAFVGRCGPLDASGHRVVHGGAFFDEPVVVDAGVRERLAELVDLAPLHQPKSLAALDALGRLRPGLPAVACFDTAFHAHMPAAAATYALPAEWRRRWGLRRYGFHGLSHSYVSKRVATLAGEEPASLRVVSCHLGAGASLAAVAGGSSVDTTMGFTPMEGLVMATRSGSVDPGLLLWLEEHAQMPPGELADWLEHRSGLTGLAGMERMEAILDAEAEGDQACALAVAVYLHRLRGAIASMAAAMGGLDVLAFAGGVGEASAAIRARAAEGLEFLGVAIDAERNRRAVPDAEIGSPGWPTRCFVVATREDVEIARGTRAALGGGNAGPGG